MELFEAKSARAAADEQPARTPTISGLEEIKRTASDRVYRAANADAEAAVALATAEAMTTAPVVEARAKKVRMSDRVDATRTARASAAQRADQLAGSVRDAIVSGAKNLDALEQELAEVRAEVSKHERRLPELEGALSELVAEVARVEQRAIRLACRALVPAAVKAHHAAVAELEAAEKRLVEEIGNRAAAVEAAERMRWVLQDAASPGSNFRMAHPWTATDKFTAEAHQAGLPVLTGT